MDFVAKTFGQFLTHTPMNCVGINRHVHFGVGSEEKRNYLGVYLLQPRLGENGVRALTNLLRIDAEVSIT